MNIRRTFLRSRPALRLVALMALLLAALTLSLSPALAQSPPGTPSSVSVSRSDGSLTASWSAVSNATFYHVTYSSNNGKSWSLAALRHGGTSITIGATNGATYIVGVRAGNDYGWGGWRNSSSSGPYTPPPPTNPPPGTPSSVSITRGDGTLTASWPAVSGATKYHVTYSFNKGKSWSLAAFNHASSSITVGVENGWTYVVGVRAGNQHGWSGWRNSAPSSPYYPPTPPPAVPSNLKAYGGVQRVTLAWDDPGDYSIYQYEYQYRADSDAAFGSWTATPKGRGFITSYTVTDLTNGTKYHFRLRAVNSGGPSASTSSVSATPQDGVSIPKPVPGIQPPERPESVTLTRAAGTLTADWPDVERATSYHVTYTADGGISWTLAALNHTASGITITGVTDTATYVVAVRGHNVSGYGQWRNSAPIAPLSDPQPVSVSNLGESTYTSGPFPVGHGSDHRIAATFTTGSNPNGYDLVSVTIQFSGVEGSPANVTVAIHSDESSKPGALKTTLNGSSPTSAGNAKFNCSTDCALEKDVTYYAVLSANGSGTGNVYRWASTVSADENPEPSDNGWTIESAFTTSGAGNTWTSSFLNAKIKVSATTK